MGKVSGKTHTKEQLDHWANLHTPNHRTHQRTHNANRRNKAHWMPLWAPDYPEYDD